MANKLAIPTPKVDASSAEFINLPGAAPAMHDMSIATMFWEADIVVKIVILLLVAASVWSWTIIFEKLKIFSILAKKMKKFEKDIWSGEPLEKKYQEIKKTADHPMSKVFVAGMYEWIRSSKGKQQNLDLGDSAKKSRAEEFTLRLGKKERILQAMDIARNKEINRLQKNLSFLATVGSAAPFIGLFGTVWGIMNSFQSIAMTKNTTLAVVAPGIAEALFATAIGLFAAIPAVIFYNKFSNELNFISNRVDDFADEFGALISRELEE